MTLHVWHPNYLLPYLTAEEFRDWEHYETQEPWGDLRADMRGVAHVLAMTNSDQDIQLMHPYFKDADTMFEKHKELSARQEDPALKAKLKAAREKHREEMAKRGTR